MGPDDRAAARFGRRSILAGTGFAVTSMLLPDAAQAATPLGSTSGTFTPTFSSLATSASTVGLDVRNNSRSTYEFGSSSGGTLDAVVWQFDPQDLPTEALRSTARVSFHDQAPLSTPSDASATEPNLGVCVPVEGTYDASTGRMVLAAPSPIVIPAATTTFWIQLYATGVNVSMLESERTPDPWVTTVGTWNYKGSFFNTSYAYAPVIALGRYA